MSNTTFPNGLTLTSTALTPDQVNVIMQALVAEILGIDPISNPTLAFSTVRVGWQKQGQPAFGINDDVCILRATSVDDPYSRVRDSIIQPDNSTTLTSAMGFTQVWNLHATIYGPNCYDRARLILSAMTLDWVHDALISSRIYAIVGFQRPSYVPELFSGQWWKRADIDIKFNEQVNESITVASAAGVDVTIITDTGLTDEFTIGTT